MTTDADPTRRRLAEIRRARREVDHPASSVALDDLEFLLSLAMDDYDMSADGVAANVRLLVEGEPADHGHLLPGPSAALRAGRTRPAPVGPAALVDAYECAACRLRAESGREPGETGDEARAAQPDCLDCGTPMVWVGCAVRRVDPDKVAVAPVPAAPGGTGR